jgi:hypothetical protein
LRGNREKICCRAPVKKREGNGDVVKNKKKKRAVIFEQLLEASLGGQKKVLQGGLKRDI